MPRLDSDTVQYLDSGGTLLTANRRQARFLFARHAESMIAAGRRAWETPAILPIDAWLAEAFRAASTAGERPARRLLDDDSVLWLWREALAADLSDTLQDAADLAPLARHAWLALRLHGGSRRMLSAASSAGDQRLFLRWMCHVEDRLEEVGAVDAALLRLEAAAHAGDLAARPIMLCGLDEATPGLRGFAAALSAGGGRIAPRWHPMPAVVHELAAADPESELEAALDWLHERLCADAAGHYALVVPDLRARRSDVERRLAAALQPSLELPGTLEHARVFDMAGGEPLAAQGIVATALGLLRLGRAPIPFDALTQLLRSPFIAGAEVEEAARAALDHGLRAAGRAGVTPAELMLAARAGGCAQLVSLLETHLGLLDSVTLTALLDRHVDSVGRILEAWGWPGPGVVTGDVVQAAEEWRTRLRALASNASLAGSLSWPAAVTEVARRCRAPFQPERGLPRLLVLDSLEDVGVPLDGLCVLGLNADTWPRSSSPDPFLPIDLQRRLGMEAATPAGRLLQAQRVQAAWLRATRELVVAWPRRRDDSPAARSPLLPVAASLPPVTALIRRAESRFAERRLERLAPDAAPPLERVRVRGGARLVELQAQCPFRAFAELRLGAVPLEEPEAGVSKTLRGRLLHEALRSFWETVRASRQLRALGAADVEELVRRATDGAAARLDLRRAGTRAAALELEWQRAAVTHLVDADLARPDFEVDATERAFDATVAGVTLSLRVDRVDRVGDRWVLVDYKTARRVSVRQWTGPRPEAPQLPLYALTYAPDVAGIAFAVAARDEGRIRGLAADAALLGADADTARLDARVPEAGDWNALRERWQDVLAGLVARYAAGDAEVAPLKHATCRNCHLASLCRVRQVSDDVLAEVDDVSATELDDG